VAWYAARFIAGLPPTDKVIELAVIHILRFEAARIVEWWGIADIFAAVHGLGGKVVLE